MIDLEKEREIYNEKLWEGEIELFGENARAGELAWLACAESKQQEIDQLKARLAAIESGELVLVPKQLPDHVNDYLWDEVLSKATVHNNDGFAFIDCESFDLSDFYTKAVIAAQGDGDE